MNENDSYELNITLGYISIKLNTMHRYFESLEFHRFHFDNMIPDDPYHLEDKLNTRFYEQWSKQQYLQN